MAEVLLTVSGSIDPAIRDRIGAGACPRADYLVLARAFDADLIDYPAARRGTGWAGRLIERVGGPNLMLAWACFRQRDRYRAIFTDGEQVGMPLALLFRLLGRGRLSTRHLMIAHILSVGKKLVFFDLFGLQKCVDRFLVYSTWQKRFVERRLRVSADRVEFTPFMVDTLFFSPERVTPSGAGGRPTICSVGLERRDYPTLIEAVRGLEVETIIAAASPWSKRSDTTRHRPIPGNVTVRRYSQYELRQLYADSEFVVVPLYDVDFQAGVTTILEAMAMGKAVICSRTSGQTDVVVEGETGLYVPVGDVAALRQAIKHLIASPAEARRMGEAGRRLVAERMSLDIYAERLRRSVRSVLDAFARDRDGDSHILPANRSGG